MKDQLNKIYIKTTPDKCAVGIPSNFCFISENKKAKGLKEVSRHIEVKS